LRHAHPTIAAGIATTAHEVTQGLKSRSAKCSHGLVQFPARGAHHADAASSPSPAPALPRALRPRIGNRAGSSIRQARKAPLARGRSTAAVQVISS